MRILLIGDIVGKPGRDIVIRATGGLVKIEIDFGRTLFIRRFRVWIDGVMVYDEIS